MIIVKITFPDSIDDSREYLFEAPHVHLAVGQEVVVDTRCGEKIGKVARYPMVVDPKTVEYIATHNPAMTLPLKRVVGIVERATYKSEE